MSEDGGRIRRCRGCGPSAIAADQANSLEPTGIGEPLSLSPGRVDGATREDRHVECGPLRYTARAGIAVIVPLMPVDLLERADSLVNRYYDPSTGQFLSVDPLVQSTGEPYAYAGDDPINNMDPLGLCWPSWACPVENALGSVGTTVAKGVADVVNTTIATSPAGLAAGAIGQATGITVGGCIGGSAFAGLGGTANLCWATTPSGQHGFTFSLGGGGGGPWGTNALIGPLFSNAQDLCDLGGPFAYGEASVGELQYSGGAQFAVGTNSRGQVIWSGVPGWAPGPRNPLPVPFTFGGGALYTWTYGG
jgi:hypothetical protein